MLINFLYIRTIFYIQSLSNYQIQLHVQIFEIFLYIYIHMHTFIGWWDDFTLTIHTHTHILYAESSFILDLFLQLYTYCIFYISIRDAYIHINIYNIIMLIIIIHAYMLQYLCFMLYNKGIHIYLHTNYINIIQIYYKEVKRCINNVYCYNIQLILWIVGIFRKVFLLNENDLLIVICN